MSRRYINVVDSIFVSRIDEFALTAVGLAFPLQNLLIAFAVGFGVGINALISRALGERDGERANRIASTGLALELLSYLVFLAIGLFFAEPFAAAQIDAGIPAADAGIIIGYTVDYLRIVLVFSFGVFCEITFERLLQSTGKTLWSMATQLIGAAFNIIFDPILIFGLLGFPRMGIAGAAAATVAGQILAAVCAYFINRRKKPRNTPLVHTIPAEPGRGAGHIQDKRAEHSHEQHILGDDLLHEPHPHGLHLHRRGGLRRVLQAPELRVHAHIRPQQRHGTDNRLQLRRQEAGAP